MNDEKKSSKWASSLNFLVQYIFFCLVCSVSQRRHQRHKPLRRSRRISVFLQGVWRVFLDPCCEQAVKWAWLQATSFSPLARPPIGRTELRPDTRKQGANRAVWIIRKWKTSCWCAGWGESRGGGDWQPYLSQKGAECEIARPPEPSHACVGMLMWLTFAARNRRWHPQPRSGWIKK